MTQQPPRYAFDDLALDVGQRRVTREYGELKLGNLTFDLLLTLVESAPNIVTYEELSEKVWDGRPVSADTVAQRVLMLRRDLSDKADHPRYVEAVRGIGYRLIPAVQRIEHPVPTPSRTVSRGWAVAAGLAIVLLTAGMILRDLFLSTSGPVMPNSVAVLPFENLSPDPDDAYFAAGIHEEILDQLTRLGSLIVIARPSVVGYADSELSIKEIAEELNVETIMRGSVRYADERVRISAQLIDPLTGTPLWAEVYDREFADVFNIQSDVAFNIANALEVELTLTARDAIQVPPTDSLEAFELLMRARLSSSDDVEYWESMLARAIKLDPEFSLPYAEIAAHYARLLRGTNEDWEEKVESNAHRALALDPDLTSAQMSLALVLAGKWRWNEAEEIFRSAYDKYPNDPEVLFHYSRFKRQTGDYPTATRMILEYLKLDPYDEGSTQLGITYKYDGKFEEAAAALANARAIFPLLTSLRIHIADVEINRGNPDVALEQLQEAELLPPSAIAYRTGQMMFTYSRLDRHEDVDRLFYELETANVPVGEATWALAYLASGDEEEAAVRLNRAIEARLAIDTFALNAFWANPWDYEVLEKPRFRTLRDRIPPADWNGA